MRLHTPEVDAWRLGVLQWIDLLGLLARVKMEDISIAIAHKLRGNGDCPLAGHATRCATSLQAPISLRVEAILC